MEATESAALASTTRGSGHSGRSTATWESTSGERTLRESRGDATGDAAGEAAREISGGVSLTSAGRGSRQCGEGALTTGEATGWERTLGEARRHAARDTGRVGSSLAAMAMVAVVAVLRGSRWESRWESGTGGEARGITSTRESTESTGGEAAGSSARGSWLLGRGSALSTVDKLRYGQQ